LKIKSIIVSQPDHSSAKSPYHELAEKYGLKIDFKPFIKVEGVTAKEFRNTRIQILEHTGVIFTSRTAVDHYFRISQEMRLTIPDTMKYFCISEATAFYLQKYIVYRKRKIFHANGKFSDLTSIMKKHKDENFLVPLSDIHKQEIPELLDAEGYKYTQATFYRTVNSEASEIGPLNYDILVFFSPQGIKSLMQNFPEFVQNDVKIACFGSATAKAIHDAGLRLDIEAPTVQAPSMTMALDQFIKNYNKV